MSKFGLFLLVLATSIAASAQRSVCIGSVGGGDANTWNIQQQLVKALNEEAKSRGDSVRPQLLMSNNEKAAKGEMQSNKCDFGLISNISREWPTPKANSGVQGGGGGGGDAKPNPPSIAHFHFLLIDKNAKKLDKFDTSVEMETHDTVKAKDAELQNILHEVANWVLDGSVAMK